MKEKDTLKEKLQLRRCGSINKKNVDKEINRIEKFLDQMAFLVYKMYEEPLYLEEANDEDTRED